MIPATGSGDKVALRKFVCTWSLFVAVLGLLAASWFIRVPDYFAYWYPTMPAPDIPLMGFIGLLILHVGWFVFIPCLVLALLWNACSHLCAKLRGKLHDR